MTQLSYTSTATLSFDRSSDWITSIRRRCPCVQVTHFVDAINVRLLSAVFQHSPDLLHRRGQDLLWGCTFFFKKLTAILFVVLNTQARTTTLVTPVLQPSPDQQKFFKTWLLPLSGGALTTYPRNYANFFLALWVHLNPLRNWQIPC